MPTFITPYSTFSIHSIAWTLDINDPPPLRSVTDIMLGLVPFQSCLGDAGSVHSEAMPKPLNALVFDCEHYTQLFFFSLLLQSFFVLLTS